MNGTSPTGLHATYWIFEQTGHTACSCGAAGDTDCTCGPRGYHESRFWRALHEDRISWRDLAWVIEDESLFESSRVILKPEATL